MKAGMTLTQMAAELERQQETKKDFVAPNSMVRMTANEAGKDVRISLGDKGDFAVTDYAHGQMASYTGIPKAYYDRLRSNDPALLSANVNRWLHDQAEGTHLERRMIRTLDGKARAFLSDKYRQLDNFDLSEAVLPVLMQQGSGLSIESCALTDQRLYIKAVTTRLQASVVEVDDIVQAGIVISNSEIGAGSVKIEPLIYRLRCKNGMIAADSSLRKYHVGRGHGGSDGDISEFFRDSTREADDRAFFMKVQDTLRAAFNETLFNRLVDNMRAAAGQPITGDPIKVVEVSAKRFDLNDKERGSVLRHLIEGKDYTRFGLLNAFTAAAQEDALDYERATQFERFGGEVLALNNTQWKEVAEAA